MQSIYLGGGCFWCTEAIFKKVKGVKSVTPGYIGGRTNNPTYEEVCNGNTGHVEVIECNFDDKYIGLNDILNIFFSTHDPTQLNRQGNDIGTQYKSAIFCTNESQKIRVEDFIKSIEHLFSKRIVTQVSLSNNFFKAEDYHFNYYNLNMNAPYCQIIIKPKLLKFTEQFKTKLT